MDRLSALQPEDTPAIIRISLLGHDQGERSEDAERVDLVEERLIEAVQKHLD